MLTLAGTRMKPQDDRNENLLDTMIAEHEREQAAERSQFRVSVVFAVAFLAIYTYVVLAFFA